MTGRTHALQCEHGAHPRYCGLCRRRVLAEAGQLPDPPAYLAPGKPMPPWFRDAIEKSKPQPEPEQPALDLEDQ